MDFDEIDYATYSNDSHDEGEIDYSSFYTQDKPPVTFEPRIESTNDISGSFLINEKQQAATYGDLDQFRTFHDEAIIIDAQSIVTDYSIEDCCKTDAEIFSSFYKYNNEKRKKITKDNLRKQIIRSFHSSLKYASKDCIPKNTIKRITCAQNQIGLHRNQLDKWNRFSRHFMANKEKLIKVSKLDPIKSKDGFKSFNNSFCNIYFSDKIITESFNLYIDYLFGDDNIENLCGRFKFRCCYKQIAHSNNCRMCWDDFYYYLKAGGLKRQTFNNIRSNVMLVEQESLEEMEEHKE